MMGIDALVVLLRLSKIFYEQPSDEQYHEMIECRRSERPWRRRHTTNTLVCCVLHGEPLSASNPFVSQSVSQSAHEHRQEDSQGVRQ